MLINCVAYENGSRLSDLTIEEISDYLARPDCFVWVALADATPEELDMMKEEFALHELAVEDARHGHQRPKIEDYGDSLFVVMHLLELHEKNMLSTQDIQRRKKLADEAFARRFQAVLDKHNAANYVKS